MRSYYIPSEAKQEHLEKIKSLIESNGVFELENSVISHNELIVTLKNKQDLLPAVNFLKINQECLFDQLIDITAVDYPAKNERFEVVYNFLSMVKNLRIRLKLTVAENELVDSISSIFKNGDWLEREVWDMFGIYFKDNNDLRRILTDVGFDGHPLRKDFPLTGFVEVSFDEESQKVVYKPVELMQAYRDFSYRNPWLNDIEKDTFNEIKQNETDKNN